jgi:hypothetical protein
MKNQKTVLLVCTAIFILLFTSITLVRTKSKSKELVSSSYSTILTQNPQVSGKADVSATLLQMTPLPVFDGVISVGLGNGEEGSQPDESTNKYTPSPFEPSMAISSSTPDSTGISVSDFNNAHSEYFEMIPNVPLPQGFIPPSFKVIYNSDPQKSIYFTILFENAQTYSTSTPSAYTLVLSCLSNNELNTWQQPAPDGTPGQIVDIRAPRNLGIILNFIKKDVAIYALSKKYYATFADTEKFKLTPGMQLLYKIAFTKDNLTLFYYKHIIIPQI